MKTYNQFIEAAMAIPAAGIIKMAVPVVGGAVKQLRQLQIERLDFPIVKEKSRCTCR